MDYIIRLADIGDCENLAYVKKEIWESTYRGIYPEEKFALYDYEKNKEMFMSLVTNEETDLYVVLIEDEIVGYMSFGKPFRPFRDYEQDIGLFYLKKEYQRNGIGKDLFSLAYETMKYRGYNSFFISCNKYNLPAQKFYEKMGGILVHTDEDMNDKSLPQVKYHYDIS